MSTVACDGCPYVLLCWAGQFKTGTTPYEHAAVMGTSCGHTMIYTWPQHQWIILRGVCDRTPDVGIPLQNACPRCNPQRWQEELLKGRDLVFIAEGDVPRE